ncbi:Uma2 family endonuclease [Acaryochloris sp. IP29b_bin.148]|uniref:Uma2 family endonuclease n=1 Tax=Acaryochloris sp. IP29b_bin.148 TaxID=2969218 RepID=UPI002636F0DE|nr:Uma2 family endonuclease [Acaryochloris sp. IP29b_bin.148]
METLTINASKAALTEAQFYNICRQNEGLRFEMTAQGDLVVMPPVGGLSGSRESDLNADVQIWNRRTGLGRVFSSSTVFQLPNGAKRSPDVAWVEQSRWDALSKEAQERFPPLAPDFVIELRSRTDDLAVLQATMQEYAENGVRLGWLINPQDQQVEIYQPEQDTEVRSLPTQLLGEEVLPGFTLDLPQF